MALSQQPDCGAQRCLPGECARLETRQIIVQAGASEIRAGIANQQTAIRGDTSRHYIMSAGWRAISSKSQPQQHGRARRDQIANRLLVRQFNRNVEVPPPARPFATG